CSACAPCLRSVPLMYGAEALPLMSDQLWFSIRMTKIWAPALLPPPAPLLLLPGPPLLLLPVVPDVDVVALEAAGVPPAPPLPLAEDPDSPEPPHAAAETPRPAMTSKILSR